MQNLMVYVNEVMEEARERCMDAFCSAVSVGCEESAQGTTEYAILVGVLVVIAIVAIVAFRDRVSELWDAISTGINSL